MVLEVKIVIGQRYAGSFQSSYLIWVVFTLSFTLLTTELCKCVLLTFKAQNVLLYLTFKKRLKMGNVNFTKKMWKLPRKEEAFLMHDGFQRSLNEKGYKKSQYWYIQRITASVFKSVITCDVAVELFYIL